MAATLKERLAEAEQALHELSIGKAPREIRDATGEQVVYTATNTRTLENYITKLKNEAAGKVPDGPMYFGG